MNDVWASIESLFNTGAKAYVAVKQADAASKARAAPSGTVTYGGNRNAVPGDYSTYPQNDAKPRPGFVDMIGQNQQSIVFALMALLGVLLVIRFTRG